MGQKLPSLDPSSPAPLYVLGSGGDESKKHWFIRIGGFNESEYVESNGDTPKQKYWDSLLGHMMPFDTVGFYNPTSGTLSPTYQPNAIPFTRRILNIPKGIQIEPLSLEYASKSFESNDPGLFFGVLLYKVNHNYNSDTNATASPTPGLTGGSNLTNATASPTPGLTGGSNLTNATASPTPGLTGGSNLTNDSMLTRIQSNILNNIANTTSNDNMTSNNTATIETTQGPIKIQFYPDVAPNHVKNFQDLARKGFYDGIVFHRIVPGFVIQAGDPNTKNDSASRDTWGTGGPGYTINARVQQYTSRKRNIIYGTNK